MCGALLLAGAAHAATVVSFSREGNSLLLRLSDGTAQVDWLSDSSFRFSRRWDQSFSARDPRGRAAVDFQVSDTTQSVRAATKYLTLTIARTGLRALVAEPDGTPIMADASEVERRDGSIIWERVADPRARFFGLGAREDAAVELRGTRTAALKPFLISTAGYAEFHVASGEYQFDLAKAKADRYRIEARRADCVDYFFFFGPAPKDILEQFLLVVGPMERLEPGVLGMLAAKQVPKAASVLKSGSLEETIHRLINGSLSGELLPAMPLDGYLNVSSAVQRQAIALGSVAPIVFGSRPEWMRESLRARLAAYFTVYWEEARDRGLPLIRALPMQFPKDAEAAKINDEFMLGDELLVAPKYQSSGSRGVYLPMGIWTRLSNNQVFSGKQTITIEAADGELPLFCRNGTILPEGANPTTLHYFPRLGAEFFLFENELEDYSQVHAAPAGDFLRLEIESRKDRDCVWIVHHVDRPRKVDNYREVSRWDKIPAGGWFYDAAAQNLFVRITARAGEDQIINISF
jgi:hypothetical protein